MSQTYELLVIGGGAAALSAARSFREAGGQGAAALVADERRIPYNRPPLSKDLLRGEISEDQLPLEDERWFHEHGTDLVGGRAMALDADRREVRLSGGRELRYRHCLLATGAEPTRLPIPGSDDPAVRVLRSLDDLRDLQRRLEPAVMVTVIGSGFIGCEIAASLRVLDHRVTLVSDETAPNERRLGDEAAQEIRGWLQDSGVVLKLGAEVKSIERFGDRLVVSIDNEQIEGELVIMATGVAPRGELAAAAGLALCDGAVPTDAAMRTRLPGLLAAGDVCAADNRAAGRRLRVEHWGDALGQGAVAGRSAAGIDAVWDDVPGFWSTIGTRTLKYAAWGDGFDQVRFEAGRNGAFTAWYGREGKLVGVLSHENDSAYEEGRTLIGEGAQWN